MEFVLCNKSKIAIKLTKQQNFAVSKALFGKLWNHWSNISFLNSENYCIPHRLILLGQTTKQSLSNFEPQKPWNISNFEGWGLTLVAYKQSLVSYHFSFSVIHNFFKKQHSDNQRHAEIDKKSSKCGATPRDWTFDFIHILHPLHHPKVEGHILKNKKVCLYS